MKHNSLYPDINPRNLGKYYTDHLMAMTESELFEKSDIAIQLAWRDSEIERLKEIILDYEDGWLPDTD